MRKYSVLNYLQEKVNIFCNNLPDCFEDIKKWEGYKKNLKNHLISALPVIRNEFTGTGYVTGTNNMSDNLILETIDVHLDESLYFPVHLYRKNENTSFPAVIICPGYGTPINTDFYVSFAMKLAQKGFIAAILEYGGTGEAADRPDFHTNINNIAAACHVLGMNEAGLRVSENISLFKYLKSRKDVKDIGITGLCQGSIITAYTVCVEEGFKACAPLCGATTYQAEITEYSSRQGGWTGISPFVFDILKYGDFQHLLSCFAPGKMLIQNNITDIHWPLSGFEKVKNFVTGIYELYGKSMNIEFRIEHAPHAYEGKHSENILKFFEETLT